MTDLIDQHKRMAMGEPVQAGGAVETVFGKGRNIHGKEEVSKKKHLREGSRALSMMSKSADHGPHDMGVPCDSDGD